MRPDSIRKYTAEAVKIRKHTQQLYSVPPASIFRWPHAVYSLCPGQRIRIYPEKSPAVFNRRGEWQDKKYSIQIARSTEEEAASGEETSKPVSVEAENTRPAVSDTLTAGDAW